MRGIAGGPAGRAGRAGGRQFPLRPPPRGQRPRCWRNWARRCGFETEIVPAVTCRGRIVSSSGIRELIERGRVSLAARFLRTALRAGRRRGERPRRGIETDRAHAEPGHRRRSDAGARRLCRRARAIWTTGASGTPSPTSATAPLSATSDELTIETFLLDPLRGRPRRAASAWRSSGRVRDERSSIHPDALKAQILKDVGVARRYFRRGAWRAAWTAVRPSAP